MFVVYKLVHECSISAVEWLIDNMGGDYDRWCINDIFPNPCTYQNASSIKRLDLILYLINSSNTEMKKTHPVKFGFRDEEDAIWFKMTWGGYTE